jgi:Tfp pilus assembly protein PilV
MNLLEPLTAGVIFFIALLASLQIDVYTAQSSDRQKDRQELASAADAAMLASQLLASQLLASNTWPLDPDCGDAAIELAKRINNAPVPSGVTRSATDDGINVLVEVEASNLAPRQRKLSPAAYGLCSRS